MTDDKTDKPIPQYLKVVNLLDFYAGYADQHKTGEKIGILLLEHHGEIEQPMMLRLRDVQRLLAHTLKIMAFFEDNVAAEILMRYFPDEDR